MRKVILIILAFSFIFISACSQRGANTDERIYVWAAIATNSPEMCNKIGTDSVTKFSFNPRGYQILKLRSKCFIDLAINSNNKKFCESVVPVSRFKSLLLDGSGYTSEHCLTQVDKIKYIPYSLRPAHIARLKSFLKVSHEGIYSQCQNRISSQMHNIEDIKHNYMTRYDACVERRAPRSRGFESQKTGGSYNNVETYCLTTAFRNGEVKNFYFGERSVDSPQQRKYEYCEYFCELDEFYGDCKENNEKFPESFYQKYFLSQARHGDLLDRLQDMPDY